MDNKRTHRNSTQMYPLIRAWLQSNQSKTNFCADQNLNIHTFNYWLTKMQSQQTPGAAPNGFIALQVDEPLQRAAEIQILYPNGNKISFTVGTPVFYVKELLELVL
jgi:hypothetical protein